WNVLSSLASRMGCSPARPFAGQRSRKRRLARDLETPAESYLLPSCQGPGRITFSKMPACGSTLYKRPRRACPCLSRTLAGDGPSRPRQQANGADREQRERARLGNLTHARHSETDGGGGSARGIEVAPARGEELRAEAGP